MKKVTKYIADDGREFTSADACKTYEVNMEIIVKTVDKHNQDPGEALIALMTGIQNILGIKLVSYNGYVKLFVEHKPCAYACTLWRTLSDYRRDYPTIYNLYNKFMTKYISLYGEIKREE